MTSCHGIVVTVFRGISAFVIFAVIYISVSTLMPRLMTHKDETNHSVTESERRASRASLPFSLLLKVGQPRVGRQSASSGVALLPLPSSLPRCPRGRDQRQTPRATFRTTTSQLKNDLAKVAPTTSARKKKSEHVPFLRPDPFLLWRHHLPIFSSPSSNRELRIVEVSLWRAACRAAAAAEGRGEKRVLAVS